MKKAVIVSLLALLFVLLARNAAIDSTTINQEIKPVVKEDVERVQILPPINTSQEAPDSKYPIRIVIPSIGLDAPVENIGLTPEGNIDVPQGNKEVGWYKYGTIPGEFGSSFMDADVYRAFSNLNKTKIGDDIYVVRKDGTRLRFAITDILIYPIDQVPLDQILNAKDGIRLNLMVCHGKPVKDTLEHRLVVYSKLV